MIRDAQGRGKQTNKNQTISVDVATLSIMHQFGPKTITFGSWELGIAPSTIYLELLRYQNFDDRQIFKILHMPIGL